MNLCKRHVIRQVRSGLTLIELMVVIGVISLLMALIIPAALSSVEAARRAGCLTNLRQVGIALNSYHNQFNTFPAACGLPNYRASGGNVAITQLKQYSVFTQLLYNMDQTVLFNGINFANGLDDFYRYSDAQADLGVIQNATAFKSVVSTFVCPSDPRLGMPGWTGGTNYRVNLGVGETMSGTSSSRGTISAYVNSSYADISDGSSNTVAFSERTMGGLNRNHFSPSTDYIKGIYFAPSSTPEESLSRCAGLQATNNNFESATGLTWSVGTFGQTCYSHTGLPNYKLSDCEILPWHPILAVISARSYHPHGVHVMYASGASRFCSDSVNITLWRAMATRSGQEVINEF